MSEDFINQLTLNYLVGGKTLNKINKIKETQQSTSEINDFKSRIQELFVSLLQNQEPEDLLKETKDAFNYFIDKSIYYFKIHDKHLILKEEEQEEQEEQSETSSDAEDYYEDDKSDNFSEENSDVGNETEDEESKEKINDQFKMIQLTEQRIKMEPTEKIVRPKIKQNMSSQGVDNIDEVNNWFMQAKNNKKQFSIIPRTNK